MRTASKTEPHLFFWPFCPHSVWLEKNEEVCPQRPLSLVSQNASQQFILACYCSAGLGSCASIIQQTKILIWHNYLGTFGDSAGSLPMRVKRFFCATPLTSLHPGAAPGCSRRTWIQPRLFPSFALWTAAANGRMTCTGEKWRRQKALHQIPPCCFKPSHLPPMQDGTVMVEISKPSNTVIGPVLRCKKLTFPLNVFVSWTKISTPFPSFPLSNPPPPPIFHTHVITLQWRLPLMSGDNLYNCTLYHLQFVLYAHIIEVSGS